MAIAKLGGYTTCTAAELASLTSSVNKSSDARLGSDGIGKHTGSEIVVSATVPGIKTLYVATGPLPADPWAPLNGAAVVTPV